MSSSISYVSTPANDTRIPDPLTPSVGLLHEMAHHDVLGVLGDAFRVSRRGGYTGRPLVAFFLVFLLCERRAGIRWFYTTYKKALKRLARVAGCKALPSSASVSRALGDVTMADATAFTDATLAAVPGISSVLTAHDATYGDRLGGAWHVLDADPSVQAFIQRGLVASDDHPEVERMAPGVPGYVGRNKRGDLRIRHVPVCHAGSGLWLSYQLWDDNASASQAIAAGFQQALAVMSTSGVPPERCIARMDGEFGSAGAMRRVVDEGVHLVTRLSRYRLLDEPGVRTVMATGAWCAVTCGVSAQREAIDIGVFALHPAKDSADEGREPAVVRVVAVRRPSDSHAGGGHTKGDTTYELFATTLPFDRFTATDIVGLYNDRSGHIENRFAQEDRELNLGRTFSYNAAGQAFVNAIGLYLWNYQTVLGWMTNPIPPVEPAPSGSKDAAWLGPDLTHHLASETEAATTAPMPNDPSGQVDLPDAVPAVPSKSFEWMPFADAGAETRRAVGKLIGDLFLDHRLPLPTQWSADPANAVLRCPGSHMLFPFSIAQPGPHRPRHQLIVRTRAGVCDGCPLRPDCFQSTRPAVYKQVARSMNAEQTQQVTALLQAHPPTAVPPPPRVPAKQAIPRTKAELAMFPARTWETPAPVQPASGSAIRRPRLRVAAIRRAALEHLNIGPVHIRLSQVPCKPKSHPFVATTNAALRRQRMTWSSRNARWASQGSATIILQRQAGTRWVKFQPVMTGVLSI